VCSAGVPNMDEWTKRIDTLDISLFDAIPSQTSPGDRRSLLAVQRAVARKHKEYVYLEIGSHLGGSIQTHLADNRCNKIYSIDPRPSQQPDDRSPGYVAHYENNSTKRMLDLLDGEGLGDVGKIECFDSDASKVGPERIISSPLIAFIDGEHTRTAAISDFQFCSKVISRYGVILFHDFFLIRPTLHEICTQLINKNVTCQPLKLEDNVFAIFYDPDLLKSDPYLAALYEKDKYSWFMFRVKAKLRQSLPDPLLAFLKKLRNMLRKKTI